MDYMTDVVVRIKLENRMSESRLQEAVNKFVLRHSDEAGHSEDRSDAPAVMIKTVPDGELKQKAIIFQDKQDAEEFLYFWRRFQLVS